MGAATFKFCVKAPPQTKNDMAGKAEEILWYEFWKLGPDRNSNFDYLIAASFFFV